MYTDTRSKNEYSKFRGGDFNIYQMYCHFQFQRRERWGLKTTPKAMYFTPFDAF